MNWLKKFKIKIDVEGHNQKPYISLSLSVSEESLAQKIVQKRWKRFKNVEK